MQILRFNFITITMVMMSGSVLAATTQLPEHESHVATTTVNVRSAPSIEAEVVSVITAGSSVTVIGQANDGTWLQIADDNGDAVGFTSARYLEPGAPPSTQSRSQLGQRLAELADDKAGAGSSTEHQADSPGSRLTQALTSGEIERAQEANRRERARQAQLEEERRQQANVEWQRQQEAERARERAEQERRRRAEAEAWRRADAEASRDAAARRRSIDNIARAGDEMLQRNRQLQHELRRFDHIEREQQREQARQERLQRERERHEWQRQQQQQAQQSRQGTPASGSSPSTSADISTNTGVPGEQLLDSRDSRNTASGTTDTTIANTQTARAADSTPPPEWVFGKRHYKVEDKRGIHGEYELLQGTQQYSGNGNGSVRVRASFNFRNTDMYGSDKEAIERDQLRIAANNSVSVIAADMNRRIKTHRVYQDTRQVDLEHVRIEQKEDLFYARGATFTFLLMTGKPLTQ